MIVLDENIVTSQREQLRAWRISFRQIGHEIGRQGMDDTDEIIPLLHHLPDPTFFSRDPDFYHSGLCHPGYCLVVLSVSRDLAALYIRRFLRHREFNTRAKRMGRVVRVSPSGISYWVTRGQQEQSARWLSYI
jgi:hypothetical protein